jgi:hypothetical protein
VTVQLRRQLIAERHVEVRAEAKAEADAEQADSVTPSP